MTPTFAELVPGTGFLTDREIDSSAEHGFLFEQGTWARDLIRHASYTLRLGDKIEIARATASVNSQRKELVVVRLDDNKNRTIELRPGDTALLYSLEQVKLPDCVLAFTVARGLLFAEGLAPENTYVDPGFSGPLYTTVVNISNRVITLEYGMPVARIFFFRLSSDVGKSYRSGPSLGIDQQLQSIRVVSVGDGAECAVASNVALLESIRQLPLGGNQLVESLNRVRREHLRLYSLAVVWPILLVVANGSKWVHDNLSSFVANASASLVAGVVLWLVPKTWTRLSKR